MATTDLAEDTKEVSIEASKVELEISADGGARAVLVPPVQELRKLHGEPVREWTTTFRRVTLSDRDIEAAKREFRDLHKDYGQFKHSGTFLNRLASMALMIGDHLSARRYFSEATGVSESQELLYRLAENELSNSDGERSGIERLALLESQGYMRACLRLAEVDLARNDIQRGMLRIHSLLRNHPDDWRANLIGGVLSLLSGEHAIAIRMFRTALDVQPMSRVLAVNLAAAHYFAGNVAHAIKSIRRAVGLDPWDERSVLFLADIVLEEPVSRRKAGDVKLASRLLSRCLDLNPVSDLIAGRITQLSLEMGDARAGIRLLSDVVGNAPTPAMLNNFAVLLWSTGDMQRAAQNLALAVERSTNTNQQIEYIAAANLLHLLNEGGKGEEAEKLGSILIERIDQVKLRTERAPSRLYIGYILSFAYQGKYEKMSKICAGLLEQKDLHPLLRVHLATAYTCYYSIVVGDFIVASHFARMAYQAYGQLERAPPGMKESLANNLAYTLIETSNYEEARQYLDVLWALPRSKFPLKFATIGLYHIRRGRLERGESEYRKAIETVNTAAQKNLLRKKLSLELAKANWTFDRKESLRFAKKALKIRHAGVPWIGEALDREIKHILQLGFTK